MSAGTGHTCGVVAQKVKCWGDNGFGQLGLGHREPRGTVRQQLGDNLPFVSLGASDQVQAVAAGASHTCALLTSGDVKCWGDNMYGQLGVGDRRARGAVSEDLGSSATPVALGAQRSAIAISAGRAHTCAVLADGAVICWGDNRFGQLGVGDRVARGTGDGAASAPAVVDLGHPHHAVAVSAGANHTCALLSSGPVKCWGADDTGQLGQETAGSRGGQPGEMGDNLAPVDLGAGQTATAIAAGTSHSCALLQNGSIKCWGANSAGQLGVGTTDNGSAAQLKTNLSTADLGSGRTARAIAAGAAHTCAVLSDGLVKCWGANLFGQLGLGDTRNRGGQPGELAASAPLNLGLVMTDPVRTSAITTSSNHTCVLLMTGEAKCWGLNAIGQLGQGNTENWGDTGDEPGDRLSAIQLVGPVAP